MPRTTATLVGTVIEVTAGDDLSSYIETATTLVDSECAASTYTVEKFELIERWLAAHFYACNIRRTQQSTVFGGVAEDVDRPKFELMLNNTLYGQQAMLLDTDGNLAALNNSLQEIKKPLPIYKVGVTWLGSNPHWPYPPES